MSQQLDIVVNPLTGLPVDDQELNSLTELCLRQSQLEDSIKEKENQLKELKAELEQVSTKLIPDRMDALGMKSLTLTNGRKVEIKPFYYAKILDGGFKWLDENGHGGIIKTEAIRQFTRDERDSALEFIQENPGFRLSENVHHSTLGAFVREVYGKGETLPEALFSVYQGSRTKLS